ncbi:hypothetical protein ACL7TT_01720 [Microbulbifer sp. 2304DJ12-6]|uniref:hypothetical protein n=1 Tax=Microbulbifer sp. 2304DJ12-6 TaxID=3233340 RepID=UPI0039B07BF4
MCKAVAMQPVTMTMGSVQGSLDRVWELQHGPKLTFNTNQIIEAKHIVISNTILVTVMPGRLLHNSHKLKLKGKSLRRVVREITSPDL